MLYMIRHGQTLLNRKKVLQGRSDAPLSDIGVSQAREAAERLKKLGVHIDRVYSSPLLRAVHTADLVAGYAPRGIDERLIEMDYGPYEGMDLEDPAPEIMEFFGDFVNVPAPAGMEQLSSVVTRLGGFLEEIKAEAEAHDVLISTHAIAMKGALEYLTPDSRGGYWSRYIANCDIYAAEVKGGSYGIPYILKEKD